MTKDPQAEPQVERIKGNLSGQKILITYREGGAVYGTYFFEEVHLCQSGNYMSFGQSRKRTILDNEQVNNWQNNGTWDVVPSQGQVLLRTRSASGKQESVPIRLLPDGRLWIDDRISIQRQGRAECR